MAFYVLDENKNLVASFDREGFLAILQQAIEQGTLENIDPDSAVASKLRSNLNGTAHYIEFVTAAQYSELENRGEIVEGTYYFITDDTTEEDLENAIGGLLSRVGSLETRADNLENRVGSLETTYNADFLVGGNPTNGTGWVLYDVTGNYEISAGMYICVVISKEESPSSFVPQFYTTAMLFVSSDLTLVDRSARFQILDNQVHTPVYLEAKRSTTYEGDIIKILKVCRESNGSVVDAWVYVHEIGGTV